MITEKRKTREIYLPIIEKIIGMESFYTHTLPKVRNYESMSFLGVYVYLFYWIPDLTVDSGIS